MDNEAAVEFLQKWRKGGPWVLTCIQPDKKGIDTATFEEEESLSQWLEKYNGQRNIYFHVNSVLRSLSNKAQKEDIKSAEWLHIDIDLEPDKDVIKERDRILAALTNPPEGIPEPTVVIFSGGGYQGFWKLEEPVAIEGDVKKAEDFELYNQRLEQILGGDHCHNVDRIMRLPGTINIPNAKKEKQGRKKELALLIDFNENAYPLSLFKQAQSVQIQSAGAKLDIPGNIRRIEDLDELDEWGVDEKLKVVIAQGRDIDNPKKKDNSRSAWLFHCVCLLMKKGVPDEVIYSLLTDSTWKISESVLENKNSDRYARRQMFRAKDYIIDPNLCKMNDRHAVIGNIGGKCKVIEEIEDEVMKRTRLTISSFDDIRNRYGHKKILIGEGNDGNPKYMPLGHWWLAHENRRQYDSMKFMPQGRKEGVYNLWRGFAVEPKPGNCSLYLEHLKENVCNGEEQHYDYLIKWMARAIQYPASPGEVAVVMRGGKGVGKSITAKIFGKLFGRHYIHISNPSHLVGNFNAHLRDVLCLFADEAFFAGDKKHESVLKMLVTEDSIPIEQKGVDVEPYPNYVHLLMAANDAHIIRASGDERRYFVLEVGDKRKQDTKFFNEMDNQMKQGGQEALLLHLQNIDLSEFQVRKVPQTDALQEQKMLSMNIEEEWWWTKLKNGKILDTDEEWRVEIPCEAVVNDFTSYAEKWRFNRRGNETAFGKFLTRVCPHLERVQRRIEVDMMEEMGGGPRKKKKRVYFYRFGSLNSCRQSWEKSHGDVDWKKHEAVDE